MSDRFVRQLDPPSKDEHVGPKRISEYAGVPNIILVGDPGAGKSHLFAELAQSASIAVLSARTFLNSPSDKAGSTVFIDALDERRAGRSDQTTIDLIVQKLFEVKATRVRVACREHDWLGGTDLAAFHPYFTQSGGHVDPYFKPEQPPAAIHALCRPDMTASLRGILGDGAAPFGIKALILEALGSVIPPPEHLQAALVRLVAAGRSIASAMERLMV